LFCSCVEAEIALATSLLLEPATVLSFFSGGTSIASQAASRTSGGTFSQILTPRPFTFAKCNLILVTEVPWEKQCRQNVHVMLPSIFSTYSQKGSFGRLILIGGSIEKKKEKDMSTF
jgi:hypothetical protein